MEHERVEGASGRGYAVLGGYGQLGRAVVSRLARQGAPRITVAGPSLRRAERACVELGPSLPPPLEARRADAADPLDLSVLLTEHEALVHMAPLEDAAVPALCRALSQTGGSAVLVSHSRAAFSRLRGAGSRLAATGAKVLLDAGADPGLLGLVGDLAAKAHGEPEQVTIVARYSAPEVGRAGLADIIDGASSAGWTYDGSWRRASPFSVTRETYPGNLSTSLAIPMCLPELDPLQARHELQRLELRHGAINGLAGLVVVSSRLFRSLAPRRFFVGALERAVRYGRGSPHGLGIAATAYGGGRARRAELAHSDVYGATAEVAAWSARLLVEHPGPQPIAFAWELLAARAPVDGLRTRSFEMKLS